MFTKFPNADALVAYIDEAASRSDLLYDDTTQEFNTTVGRWKIVVDGEFTSSDYHFSVVHFIDQGLHIKFESYYNSYDGSDWDESEWSEVNPVEKLVTVYE